MKGSTKKDRRMASLNIKFCEVCGYKEHMEILTIHHIFWKRDHIKQPPYLRKFRYVVMCPNCHSLCNVKIYSDILIEIIKKRLDEAEERYGYSDVIDATRYRYGIYNSDSKLERMKLLKDVKEGGNTK